jgi:uncharacterized membrane protein YedE/YeeE
MGRNYLILSGILYTVCMIGVLYFLAVGESPAFIWIITLFATGTFAYHLGYYKATKQPK